jgi:hypothetical protein
MTKVHQDHRRASRFGGLRRALPAITASAAMLTLCAGCGSGLGLTGSGSPSVRSTGEAGRLIDQRREAFQIDHDAYAGLGYRLDWRGFPVVQRGEHIRFLDAYDDLLIAHESAATISVLEASNGALRNSSQVASPLTRFVGNFRDGNHLVVSSDNEAAVIDLDTGDIIQRADLDRVVSTAPIFFGGQKIYGTSIGHVYSHYLNPPVNSWAFDMGSPIDAELALVGQTVVAVSRNGRIAMLDAPTGSLLAQASIFGGCEADPVAGEGAVFFASLDQSIYAYNLEGKRMWRVRTEQPLRITPTYHAGVLYVASDDQGLRALDANTGTQLWSQPEVAGRVVAVRRGKLVTWDGSTACTVDPATGDVVTTATLTEVEILKPDHFADGNLYAVSRSGVVAKFKPRD